MNNFSLLNSKQGINFVAGLYTYISICTYLCMDLPVRGFHRCHFAVVGIKNNKHLEIHSCVCIHVHTNMYVCMDINFIYICICKYVIVHTHITIFITNNLETRATQPPTSTEIKN